MTLPGPPPAQDADVKQRCGRESAAGPALDPLPELRSTRPALHAAAPAGELPAWPDGEPSRADLVRRAHGWSLPPAAPRCPCGAVRTSAQWRGLQESRGPRAGCLRGQVSCGALSESPPAEVACGTACAARRARAALAAAPPVRPGCAGRRRERGPRAPPLTALRCLCCSCS